MRTLKMRNEVGGHQKLTTNWGQSLKLILLQLHEKLPKNSVSTILWLLGIWSKLEIWKSWVPHELTANQKKIIILKWCLLLFYTTNRFSIGLWHVTKSDFTWQLVMTSSVVGLRSSEALPKAKLAPKKVMVTIWWSPAGLIHYSFLNPDETITSEKYAQQINKMHWKPQCLQLVLVNRKGPILHDNAWPHIAQLMLQKLNKLGTRLCLICHIHLCQGTFNFKESYMLFSVSQGPSVPYQFLGNRNEQRCTQFSGLRSRGRTHTWIPFSNLLLFCKTT